MSSTDLGACEWFVWDLRRSNLIDRGQLDQVIGEFLKTHPRAEPPALADYLVKQGILSDFQAERLLQGKTQGLVLGPYTLLDALGTGSMGTVYKAQNKNDTEWYAVKVLPRRSMWNVRIARRQVRQFEQCRHPAVVPFVDVGTSGGTHYLAWPLVEGVGLDVMVQEKGPLDPATASLYALQTAEGLDICHQAGLIHGLLKPSNLMVGPDNQVRILDFGIGTLLTESEGESLVDTMSTANSLTSGLDCGSPESILEPTNRTPAGDQYSLGCTFYYCLTGRYPFPEGTAVEKMMAHQMKQPTPIKELNPEVPDELIAIVDRLMGKTPELRFPQTSDLIEALRPLVDPSAVAAAPVPRSHNAVTHAAPLADEDVEEPVDAEEVEEAEMEMEEEEAPPPPPPPRRAAPPPPAPKPAAAAPPPAPKPAAAAPPPRPAAAPPKPAPKPAAATSRPTASPAAGKPAAAKPPSRPSAAPSRAGNKPPPVPARPAASAAGGGRLPSRDLFTRPPGPKGQPPKPKPAPEPVEDEEILDNPEVQEGAEVAGEEKEEKVGMGTVILVGVLAAVITYVVMNFIMPPRG
jgi:serine/threonine-protein kinase